MYVLPLQAVVTLDGSWTCFRWEWDLPILTAGIFIKTWDLTFLNKDLPYIEMEGIIVGKRGEKSPVFVYVFIRFGKKKSSEFFPPEWTWEPLEGPKGFVTAVGLFKGLCLF